jgi:hypothetical protein
MVDTGIAANPSPKGVPLKDRAPWPAFYAQEPDSPDNCITVFDTTGQPDGRSMPDGEPVQHFGISVMVRGSDLSSTWVKANFIRNNLAKSVYYQQVTVDGATYLVECLSKLSQPIFQGKETNPKRLKYLLNALMTFRKLTGGVRNRTRGR